MPISCSRDHGVLSRYPTRKGMAYRLRGVLYRNDAPMTHKIVIRWQPGLPKKRDQPWYLMTDLQGRTEALCDRYGRRTSVEELFRDHKCRRDGFALRNPRIRNVERFDRFLLILVLAYLLLGWWGCGCKRNWTSTRRRGAPIGVRGSGAS